MNKFEELFASYPFEMTEEQVKAEVAAIVKEHFDENNHVEVWKKCLSFIDLTTLNGDDTEEKVVKMASAVNDFTDNYPCPNVASICVYPSLVPAVKETLNAEGVGITAVVGGFPAAQTFIEVKVAETALTVAAGATEVDMVLSQGKFLEGNYEECFEEIEEIKAAAKDAHFKVILETGALKTPEKIWKASILALAAGAEFIKTSTGKISVNATPEATYIMCRAVKAWYEKTGEVRCYKAAGGVATTDEAVLHYSIMKDVLGEQWLDNQHLRFGASRLANNLLTSIMGEEVKYF